MKQSIPMPHADPWVNLLHGYVTEAVHALTHRGFQVRHSWLDPRDPRDATIVYRSRAAGPEEDRALVWDEETGWRGGRFVSGEQGVRTTLADIVHHGDGVLISPVQLAHSAAVIAAVSDRSARHRRYRSYADRRDGLDDALRAPMSPPLG